MAKRSHSAAEQYVRVNDGPEHAVQRPERIGLTHILRPEIDLAVWQRHVPGGISAWLSRISGEDLRIRPSGIDSELPLERVRATILSEMPMIDAFARAGVTALADDATGLADLFAQISGSSSVRLRLEWVTQQQCPRFHADRVPMRLLCTYRGPGTEWIANDVTLASPDADPHESMLNRLGTGDVAIMKGSPGAGASGALRHRSPKLQTPDDWRLLLSLDPAIAGAVSPANRSFTRCQDSRTE